MTQRVGRSGYFSLAPLAGEPFVGDWGFVRTETPRMPTKPPQSELRRGSDL
jgi:hypothetical protein